MAACKLILVTYLENSKILRIPTDAVDELNSLEQQFVKKFKVASGIKFSFQRYDLEWGEYVDLDEESTLNQKEKIKAIINSSPVVPSSVVLSPEVSLKPA